MTDDRSPQPSLHLLDYSQDLLDLLDRQRIAVLVHGPSMEILAYNRAMCSIAGIGSEGDGRSMLESLVFYDIDGVVIPTSERPIARVLATRAPVFGAILGLDRADNGERVWLDCNLQPVLDDHGQIRHIVRTCTDVTELIQTSIALRQRMEAADQYKARLTALHEVNLLLATAANQDELLRRAVELGRNRLGFSRCSIWLLDQTTITMRGTFGIDETGAVRDEREFEFIANPLWLDSSFYVGGVTAHDRSPLYNATAGVVGYGWQATAAILDENDVVGILCVDDLLKPLESDAERSECSEILGLYGLTVGHLFGRLQVTRALRASEDRIRAIVEQAPLGIAVVDEQGCPRETNEALRSLLGYSAAELQSMSFTDFTHPDDISADWQLYRELISGERTWYQIEKRYLRKNGEIIDVRLTVALLRDQPDAGRFAIGIVEDITQFKQTMNELQNTLESLHTLARRLQTVREEERSHIAREVHDELAQSLTGIKLDLAWLGRHACSTKTGVSMEDLLARVEGMTGIVESAISTVRRIASELRPPILDALGLVPALEWLAADFEKRTGIRCAFVSNVETLELDKERATAAFRTAQESLTNVIRHAAARHVTLGLAVSDSELTLTIADDGIGISDTAVRDPHSSGLVGIRERARLLHGHVSITSLESKGATVVLVIPLLQALDSASRQY